MDSTAVPDPIAATFPCPTWCDRRHDWRDGDDTHWTTHAASVLAVDHVTVDVWQSVTDTPRGIRTDAPCIAVDADSSQPLSPARAHILAAALTAAAFLASDIADPDGPAAAHPWTDPGRLAAAWQAAGGAA